MVAATLSRGIVRTPNLPQMLGCEIRHLSDFQGSERPQIIYGWGAKPNTLAAREAAERLGLPFVRLEDGFIRSHGLGVDGAPPLSVVVDNCGIYYDARQPSDLEVALNSGHTLPAEVLADAQRAMRMMLDYGVSKYTYAPDLDPRVLRAGSERDRRVLVVDQTFGDMSVECGLAEERSFEAMLDAAISENPDAQVWVKVHPDVLTGKKRGYLYEMARARGIPVLAEHCNPYSLLPAFERIYTVTSQMGFEALMVGKKVTCFGVPFYSGWGLTDDRVRCERRAGTRSLAEVFAFSHILYPRYLNPVTMREGTIFDVLGYLAKMRQRDSCLYGRVVVIGMRRWKRAQVLPFLKTATNEVVFVSGREEASSLRLGLRDTLVTWGYQQEEVVRELVETHGCRRMVVEDGFFRSIGLGSDFVAPLSLVVDSGGGGVYYNAKTPSDIERLLLEGHRLTPEVVARAAALRQTIVEQRLTKYNVDDCEPVLLDGAEYKKVIFVPGQVETDASIALATSEVRTNLDLLRRVRMSNPHAFIVYKPHPEVVAGNRTGGVPVAQLLEYCDHIELQASCLSLIDAAHEVHVMTSQVGFDALMRGKKVTCYGMPFYAGWGLTRDLAAHLVAGRRGVERSLDELVAAALILYPTYVNPASGEVFEAEQAIALLARQTAGDAPRPRLGAGSKVRLALRQVRRGFAYVFAIARRAPAGA